MLLFNSLYNYVIRILIVWNLSYYFDGMRRSTLRLYN